MATWKEYTRSTKRRWRSPATWLLLMVIGVFGAAACGGGNDSPTEVPGGVADAGTNPLSANNYAASGFQIEAFSNENHVKGELISLDRYLGQVVVVNFWFPSCPPCRAEMPDLQESFLEHQADGVEFVGIQLLGLDSAEEGQEFIDEISVTYAIGPDANGSIFQEYGVTSFPTTFFLDRNHNIVRKWGGFLTSEILEEQIQNALAIEVSPTA